MLAEGGLKLHPDSERRLAETQRNESRLQWLLLWLVVAAGCLLWWLS
jgi:hypothetical protein